MSTGHPALKMSRERHGVRLMRRKRREKKQREKGSMITVNLRLSRVEAGSSVVIGQNEVWIRFPIRAAANHRLYDGFYSNT